MNDFESLLTNWTIAELRDALAVGYETAASMKRRGSVAPAHWPALLDDARKKGLPLDASMLIRFRANRKTNAVAREAA